MASISILTACILRKSLLNLAIHYLFATGGRRGKSFGGKSKFISHLGGNISYFKAAETSDASHNMEEVVIAEH
jgi:hypothetical protein